jgi:cysteinyl-tRNA synthetase
MIRLYNTLSKSKQDFDPIHPGKVGIYLCGPTVYKPSHIGHMVGPVIFDAIKRYLTYCGYEVTLVINITDIDDKLIDESKNRGIPVSDIATEMTDDYMVNLSLLGVDTVDHFPYCTQHIDDIIDLTSALIKRGYAYEAEGDVYFEVGKASEYGKLSHRGNEAFQGDGGGMAERKRSLADFALWKSAKPGEPSWESPWGPGRPGWHIECSAMSKSLLGETFDIHGGGLDLVFPHHENELAQSECAHGKQFVKYWMHNGLMQASSEIGKVGGRQTRAVEGDLDSQQVNKIAKSTGAKPFRELLAENGFTGEQIRFFLLSTHYRRPIDFSVERIRAVGAGLETFYRFFKRYERITGKTFYDIAAPVRRADGEVDGDEEPLPAHVAERRTRFLEAMDDDFNTGGAIGEMFELVRGLNKFADDRELEDPAARERASVAVLTKGTTTLRELAATLGLFSRPPKAASADDDQMVAKLLDLLIEIRADARKAKNFSAADKIRDSLAEIGVSLEDRPGGTEWSIK